MGLLVGDQDWVHARFVLICAVIPHAWLQQCLDASQWAVAVAAPTVLSLAIKGLGWRLPAHAPPSAGMGNIGQPVMLSQLMVKTTLQLGLATMARRIACTAHVR